MTSLSSAAATTSPVRVLCGKSNPQADTPQADTPQREIIVAVQVPIYLLQERFCRNVSPRQLRRALQRRRLWQAQGPCQTSSLALPEA